MASTKMKFGVFMAPFHRPGENPTLALERDLELIQWLDILGFDEAYVGEHHSAGWETIASPELFLATAAERTRHIRLGTGVISLPYHHPLMVANRMVLLDHLTRVGSSWASALVPWHPMPSCLASRLSGNARGWTKLWGSSCVCSKARNP